MNANYFYAKNVKGNSIPGWITCIPYYDVPRKISILIDNFEGGGKKIEYFQLKM